MNFGYTEEEWGSMDLAVYLISLNSKVDFGEAGDKKNGCQTWQPHNQNKPDLWKPYGFPFGALQFIVVQPVEQAFLFF